MSSTSGEKKREPARAPAKRKRSSPSPSSVRNDDSCDNEQVSILAAAVPAPSSKKGQGARRRRKIGLQMCGDYVLKFQDDKTGSKRIHPTALRHTLGLVDELAKSTTKSVAKSLAREEKAKESRVVQVRSKHHVRAITARVRDKLHEAHIPARYVKIQDLCLHDMEGTNQRRRDDIASNEKIAMKLEHQLDCLQKQYDVAKRRRDEAQEMLDDALEEMNDEVEIHPMLQTGSASDVKDDCSKTCANVSDNIQACVQTEGTSLVDWLKSVPSPYD